MKVYTVWWLHDMEGIFSTWQKASDYIDHRVAELHTDSGYNLMPEFHMEEEEVQ